MVVHSDFLIIEFSPKLGVGTGSGLGHSCGGTGQGVRGWGFWGDGLSGSVAVTAYSGVSGMDVALLIVFPCSSEARRCATKALRICTWC